MTYLDLKIGNIHLTDRLGKGGMGTVYVGFDEKLHRQVAVKAIRGDRIDAETRARLLREARLLSQLDHPNICRIHDYIEGEVSDYLVLELVPGSSLDEALATGLELPLKMKLAEQIASALAAAHAKGIIHRDLKPTNVMLTPSGEAKVLDFGLARSVEPKEGEWTTGDYALLDPAVLSGHRGGSASIKTEAGDVVGTASYMSPEQARGESITAASDVYSLGLVMQELFTERPPYEPELQRELVLIKAADGDTLPVTDVSPGLADLIVDMKSLGPASRPPAALVFERLQWIRNQPKRRFKRVLAFAAAVSIVTAIVLYVVRLEKHLERATRDRQQAEIALTVAEKALSERARLLEDMIDRHEQALGSEHIKVAEEHSDAALFYELSGDDARAKRHYRRALMLHLGLDRLAEAGPIAEKLSAKGWGDPELWDLCRERGLKLEAIRSD